MSSLALRALSLFSQSEASIPSTLTNHSSLWSSLCCRIRDKAPGLRPSLSVSVICIMTRSPAVWTHYYPTCQYFYSNILFANIFGIQYILTDSRPMDVCVFPVLTDCSRRSGSLSSTPSLGEIKKNNTKSKGQVPDDMTCFFWMASISEKGCQMPKNHFFQNFSFIEKDA